MRIASGVFALGLLLSGCLYQLTGGGLPPHIRTVALLPFENATPEPGLGSDVNQRLQLELPRKLGVRLADERRADALVRGRITGYSEQTPSYVPGAERVEAVTRRIDVAFEAEIFDVRQDRVIWKGGATATGNFEPGREQSAAGRGRAIEQLIQRIVDGAQSQW